MLEKVNFICPSDGWPFSISEPFLARKCSRAPFLHKVQCKNCAIAVINFEINTLLSNEETQFLRRELPKISEPKFKNRKNIKNPNGTGTVKISWKLFKKKKKFFLFTFDGFNVVKSTCKLWCLHNSDLLLYLLMTSRFQ